MFKIVMRDAFEIWVLIHDNIYLYKIIAKLSCFRPFTLKLFLVTIFLFKNDLKLFRQATDIFSARNYAAD